MSTLTIVSTLAEAPRLRPGRRLAFAGRVSDEDEEDKSYGLEIQEDDVRKFAAECGWDLILDPALSGYESGRLPLEHRRIYQNIKRAAASGFVDAVCFGRINRIARKTFFALQLIDELKQLGIEVLTADLRIDTSEPAGEYVRQIMIATAEFDASSILKNTAAGRAKRLNIKDGRQTAPAKPWLSRRHYGYRYTKPSAMGKRDGVVTVHEGEKQIIRWMFERRAQHWSYGRIAARLTADAVPSPAGQVAWSATTVRNIINNPSYKGTGHWGRRTTVRTTDGKPMRRLRRDGRKPDEMEFPRLVSDDLWDAAHSPDVCGHGMRAPKSTYLLSGGMLQCAEHALTMGGTSNGSGHARYRCTRQLGGSCTKRQTHNIPAGAIEEAVWTEFLRFLADPVRGRRGVQELLAQREQAIAAEEAQLLVLRQRERTANEKIDAALEIALTSKTARERLEAKIAAIEEGVEQVRREIRQAEARLALARVDIPAADEVARVCRTIAKGAYHADAAGKRVLCETVQLQVWVRDEEWWAEGILPGLRLEGTLTRGGVQVASPPQWASDLHPAGFRLTGTLPLRRVA